jgi:hypothetical protein
VQAPKSTVGPKLALAELLADTFLSAPEIQVAARIRGPNTARPLPLIDSGPSIGIVLTATPRVPGDRCRGSMLECTTRSKAGLVDKPEDPNSRRQETHQAKQGRVARGHKEP